MSSPLKYILRLPRNGTSLLRPRQFAVDTRTHTQRERERPRHSLIPSHTLAYTYTGEDRGSEKTAWEEGTVMEKRLQTFPSTQKRRLRFHVLPYFRYFFSFSQVGTILLSDPRIRALPANPEKAGLPQMYMLTLLVSISAPPAERRRCLRRRTLWRDAITSWRALRRRTCVPTRALRRQLRRAP